MCSRLRPRSAPTILPRPLQLCYARAPPRQGPAPSQKRPALSGLTMLEAPPLDCKTAHVRQFWIPICACAFLYASPRACHRAGRAARAAHPSSVPVRTHGSAPAPSALGRPSPHEDGGAARPPLAAGTVLGTRRGAVRAAGAAGRVRRTRKRGSRERRRRRRAPRAGAAGRRCDGGRVALKVTGRRGPRARAPGDPPGGCTEVAGRGRGACLLRLGPGQAGRGPRAAARFVSAAVGEERWAQSPVFVSRGVGRPGGWRPCVEQRGDPGRARSASRRPALFPQGAASAAPARGAESAALTPPRWAPVCVLRVARRFS